MDQPTSFDIRKILEFLPHRYPFLLVDRVNEIVTGNTSRRISASASMNRSFRGISPASR